MTHKKAMEAVDRMFRDIMERDVVFGGKLVVLCGDFCQTRPVVRNGNRAETVSACLNTSYIWRSIQISHLRQNMRALIHGDANAQEFSNQLLTVGDGRKPNVIIGNVCDYITVDHKLCKVINSLEIESVYPKLESKYLDT